MCLSLSLKEKDKKQVSLNALGEDKTRRGKKKIEAHKSVLQIGRATKEGQFELETSEAERIESTHSHFS